MFPINVILKSRVPVLRIHMLRLLVTFTVLAVIFLVGDMPHASGQQSTSGKGSSRTQIHILTTGKHIHALDGATVEDAVVVSSGVYKDHCPFVLYRMNGDWKRIAAKYAKELEPATVMKSDDHWEILKQYESMNLFIEIGPGRKGQERFENIEWAKTATGITKIAVMWKVEPSVVRSQKMTTKP